MPDAPLPAAGYLTYRQEREREMRTLLRCMKADFMKMKGTALVAAHLAIPTAMAGAFLLYYKTSPWDSFLKVQAFFQLMGMGYPFLIGVFCAIIAEQELAAGSCQGMLAVTDRRVTFLSKLLFLVLLGGFSVSLASVLFGTGFFFGMKQHAVAYSFYWTVAGTMLGGNLLLYVLHLFLAFRLNKGVTVGLGVAESLLSAVLMTGLGDGGWIFVPAVWANRLTGYRMFAYSAAEAPSADTDGLAAGYSIMIIVIVTILSFLLYMIWACRWDGVCGDE